MSKKTKNNVLNWLIIIILAVTAAGCVGYLFWQERQNQEYPSQEAEPSQSSEEQGTTEDPVSPEANTEPDSGKTDQTPAQYEGESANKSEKITGQITYAAKSGNKLVIRVSIDQYLKTSGTCKLTLTKNSKTVQTLSAPTLDDPTSATCQGFDLDATKLKGNYDIKIKITAGTKAGTIAGKVNL